MCARHHFSQFLSVECLVDKVSERNAIICWNKWMWCNWRRLQRRNMNQCVGQTYISSRGMMLYTHSLILFIYKWIRWIEMNGLSHSTWINEQLRNKNLDSFQLHLRTHHSVKLKIYQCSFVHRFIFCFWPLFFLYVCHTSDLFGIRSNFSMS